MWREDKLTEVPKHVRELWQDDEGNREEGCIL